MTTVGKYMVNSMMEVICRNVRYFISGCKNTIFLKKKEETATI